MSFETVRINELAKELGLTSKEVIEKFAQISVTGKTHSSTVTIDQIKRLKEFIETPNLMRHMDTPVTVEHEIEFLLNAGFSEAYVKGDTGKYQLVIGKK